IVGGAACLARSGSDDQVARWAVPAARGELVLSAVLGGIDGVAPAADQAALILLPSENGVYLLRPGETVSVEPQHVEGGPGAAGRRPDTPPPAGEWLIDDPAAPGRLIAHLTAGAAAYQLGVVERALELAAEYTRTREQFGRPIGAFQAVSQRLADAY